MPRNCDQAHLSAPGGQVERNQNDSEEIRPSLPAQGHLQPLNLQIPMPHPQYPNARGDCYACSIAITAPGQVRCAAHGTGFIRAVKVPSQEPPTTDSERRAALQAKIDELMDQLPATQEAQDHDTNRFLAKLYA